MSLPKILDARAVYAVAGLTVINRGDNLYYKVADLICSVDYVNGIAEYRSASSATTEISREKIRDAAAFPSTLN